MTDCYRPTHGPDEPAAPPDRTPGAADLALAKAAVPWLGIWGHIDGNTELAQALAAWLTARGIY